MKRKRVISDAEAKGAPSSSTKCKTIDKDRISGMPDDVIHTIVSLLSMREAVRTCAISRRWKNMFLYMSNIEFKWRDVIRKSDRRSVQYFLATVDRFLACHLGPKVASFKVSCCFGSIHADHINEWIRFAVEKGVENLDLAFTCDDPAKRADWRKIDYYHFPTQLLLPCEESKLRHLSLRSCTLQSDFNDRFRTLSTLVLCDVNLAGGVEPHMFASCSKLESLTLQWCFGLERLCIGDSLLRLKVLVVSLCEGLKKIELSATNINSFRYKGDAIEITFERVPNLEEVYIMLKDINVEPTFAQLQKELPHVKAMAVSKIH